MKHIAIDSLGQCEHTRDSITIDGRTISPMRHNYHSASDGVQVRTNFIFSSVSHSLVCMFISLSMYDLPVGQ